ncbi:hypothetical protein [Planctomycetes bacterium K23_9]|uniref:Uncharacterized protein n=1 Tax=Stieleria marina TaxID=1930275 RepID=A0A517NVV8_9BACT|nr:hypothetical protein K239x_32450 [Planctomycetes bacterium K23_9]
MGYTGHTSTPPRSIRVILGAKIALACMFFGSTMLTNRYHSALSMKDAPVEMEWQQLADQGLTDNSFVTLTDVQLKQADDNSFDQFMDQFGVDADTEEIEAQFAAAMEDMDAAEVFAMSMAPIQVIPIGADPNSTRELIAIPRNEAWMTEAEYQLDEYGTLSGYVSSFSGDEIAKAMVKLFDVEDAVLEERLAGAEKVYVLQPMREPLDKSQASTNFWFCGLGVSFGLILCCSGGPSALCCVFFMLPSLISLLGYPMRYGRGGNFAKLVYLIIGGALAGVGYQFLIAEGQLGQPNGNPFMHAIGFVALFVGFGAMLSVPTQILCRKLAASVEPPSNRKASKRLSYEAACSLTPPEPEEDAVTPAYIMRTQTNAADALLDSTGNSADTQSTSTQSTSTSASAENAVDPTTYFDSKLTEADAYSLDDELQSISDSLAPLGFASPLAIQWNHQGQTTPTLIQLGCENMVVCDVEMIKGDAYTRLVSVLHDGIAVITLSKGYPVKQDQRLGTSGYYSVADSHQPIDMIGMHLQETVSKAEKRNTSVVLIDTCEVQHACHFGRRVLAEIQSQYGEIDQEVASKNYGRFNVPAKRVIGELTTA